MKTVLVITPKFPFPKKGACEQDRAAGIELLLKFGYNVHVITKIYAEEYKPIVQEIAEKFDITIAAVTYKYLHGPWCQKLRNGLKRFIQPWYWDGAAFEYSEPEIRTEVQKALDVFHPDFVWVDYTYLWPLYNMIQKKNIPIITRSINFEALHFLEEDGRTLVNYIKCLPKLFTEYIVSRKSSVVCAITPKEAELYKKMRAKKVVVLPLRGLPNCLAKPIEVHEQTPLHVFFSGSTYNVAHNRKALEFLLTKVITQARKKFPNQFLFHIFGGKIPKECIQYFTDGVIKHDYLSPEKFDDLMNSMDIAVAPSIYGAGMQQKIFEPLARGFPTITSKRGLAGYPFRDQEHLLLAQNADEFVARLGELRNIELRRRLSQASRMLSQNLFSKESIERIVRKIT